MISIKAIYTQIPKFLADLFMGKFVTLFEKKNDLSHSTDAYLDVSDSLDVFLKSKLSGLRDKYWYRRKNKRMLTKAGKTSLFSLPPWRMLYSYPLCLL